MSSSWDSAEKSFGEDAPFAARERLPDAAPRGAGFSAGGGAGGLGARGGPEPDPREGENSDRSLSHVGQRRTPMAFHVSQCPQTMPISFRNSQRASRGAPFYTKRRAS